jgi:excisionase family DNA binding protein
MHVTFLTTKQVSDVLGISVMGVGHAVRRGSLEAVKIGRDHLITPEAAERYRQLYSRPRHACERKAAVQKQKRRSGVEASLLHTMNHTKRSEQQWL